MLGYTHIDETVLKLTAVDPNVAMTRCTVVLAVLFMGRTWRNFGPQYLKKLKGETGEWKHRSMSLNLQI